MFGEIGELFFEVQLIAADGENIPVETLLDTGFTTGWLALDLQDAESLGWSVIERRKAMQTARGEEFFDLYEGRILLDNQEYIVPVHVGAGIPEVLLGLQWLETRKLVVDRPQGVLTLG
ncbi:aspartyl protease [Iningainema tapete]|uniref:Aspartyl protease n=1 Tax=Iningainema tapete BLCC-T55 TaxID=2748662 RepID=A0A8J7C9M3_9CYAN|nr:aspartyl protease [Iningainema tapete]MBD2778274.1 aspartyl protease [Iningainema tapete BLCC-T55]